jgi:hypothetical protein
MNGHGGIPLDEKPASPRKPGRSQCGSRCGGGKLQIGAIHQKRTSSTWAGYPCTEPLYRGAVHAGLIVPC